MAPPRGRLLFRLLGAYAVVVVGCLLAVGLPLHLALRRDYVSQAARSFRAAVARMQPALRNAAERDNRQRLDRLCELLNAPYGGRITLFDAEGNILGDAIGRACLDRAAPECIERIRSARKKGRAPDAGLDDTLALPVAVDLGARGMGRVRLALPMEPAYAQARRINGLLALGAVAGGALALGVGIMLARRLARPLVLMTRAAEAIAGGDFEQPVHLSGGDEIGRLGQAIDRMRRNLQADVATIAEERNRVLVIIRHMSEGVLALGPGDRVELCNHAFAHLFGLDGLPSRGTPLETLGVDIRLRECVARVRETHRPASAELGDVRAGERVLSLSAGPIPGDAEATRKAPWGVVVVVHDVTESRRIEHLGRELVANASHELRTPLAAIASAVETLQGTPDGDRESLQAFLEIIGRQARRLQTLVENTLQLSRIDAMDGRLQVEPVDISYVLDDALAAAAEEASGKGLQLQREVPDDMPPFPADGHLLSQAVRNLLSNAVRYTPPGGNVTLRAERNGQDLVVSVSDTGPGIPPEEQARVFDRFFRGRSAAGCEGVGIGLAIVQRVAQIHGGRVTLESRPDTGTTFRLILPGPAADSG